MELLLAAMKSTGAICALPFMNVAWYLSALTKAPVVSSALSPYGTLILP